MKRPTLYLLVMLLAFSCLLSAKETRPIKNDERKAWNSRKAHFEDNYVIVTRSGSTIMALAPYEVKGDRAVFRILINYREGPLTSLPLSEIDSVATKRANDRPQAKPAAKPRRPVASHPSDHSPPPTATGDQGNRGWGMDNNRSRPGGDTEDHSASDKADLSDAEKRLVGLRRIQRGMSRAALLASWGEPDRKEESELTGGDVWLYLVAGETPYRVTVANGKVMQIQQDDRLVFVASMPRS